MRRALVALPLAAALLLTGCSDDPQDEVRDQVADVIGAANDRDAVAVRLEVDDLLSTLRAQTASGDLTPQEAAAVANAARAVAQSAGLLEATPSPSPVPTVEQETEEPSPSPEPEVTEEPSPTPEPEQTEEPEESPEPEPSTPPVVEVTPAVVQTQSAAAPSPSPAAAQLGQASPEPSAAPA